MRLLDFQKNVHSQTGEDGILEQILATLPTRNKWCVEFGAWDGQLFSNTCHLIEEAGYAAVMIEADPERYQDLLKRHGGNPRFEGINAFVGFTEKDSLDTILARTAIPVDFDVLSIDIDGNDYHAWKSTTVYKPRVVVIEYNPTIPTEFEYVQNPDPKRKEGCSLLSFVLLGRTKGYELVAVTALNAIFVLSEYFPLFQIANNSPRALREDISHLTYLASSYDGKVMIMGHGSMPWHEIKYAWLVRQLPKMFQAYPLDFDRVRMALFRKYKSLLKRRSGRSGAPKK